MDYLIKINQSKSEFTTSDKKIARYIINHPKEIVNSNTSKLAEVIDTSQSAIVRFVKKIGYRGYVDLKVDIAKSLEADNDILKDEVIAESDDIDQLIEKTKNNVLTAVDKTYTLLDVGTLENVVNKINKNNSIYLAGVGSSGLVCEDLLYKLQRAGKIAFYQQDPHTNMALLTNIKKEDVLICISYSGTTKEILLSVDYAKKVGATVISITKSANNILARASDEVLLIPAIEKEMRFGAVSSRFSSQIITDILYYGYVANNMDQVLDNMKVSKELTNKLKDR